ncbi:hypothetical protein AVEN_177425-1 [Araneus ventricosus]|uniref:Uncharacterized protein n=1 Tax=Araneus ventricosus TaxID=182803 RepID=A0A4Y2IMQ7_ARAVE|nr:hypothetical protein AVEN_177425-1 [Araneus ventricosus]
MVYPSLPRRNGLKRYVISLKKRYQKSLSDSDQFWMLPYDHKNYQVTHSLITAEQILQDSTIIPVLLPFGGKLTFVGGEFFRQLSSYFERFKIIHCSQLFEKA